MAGAAIPHGAAHGSDAAWQDRVAHGFTGPQGVEELVLRHDPIAIRDQVEEHVEYLRFEPDALSSPPQFEAALVDNAVEEGRRHRSRVALRSAEELVCGPCVRGEEERRTAERSETDPGPKRGEKGGVVEAAGIEPVTTLPRHRAPLGI